ncbi:DUF4952 domain-containing protein [Rhizobium sp. 768_B6_N1_8]|uniref:DUF4952 domain-containing protein n=1 Tax=unclassified Rhizobium TaxID=2613769 RepID=UPI003F2893AA
MKFAACLFAIWSLCNAFAPPLMAASAPILVTAQGCGDFLAQIQKKPDHVEFAGCSYAPRIGRANRLRRHIAYPAGMRLPPRPISSRLWV